MPFVQAKCESCAGILAVDSSLKAAICPFCGSAYVVSDAINYFNTTFNVENFHADVVNVSDENTSEGRFKAAEAYMKLGKFDKAEEEFKKVTELTPQNHKGWLGLIEAHTENYTKRIKSKRELQLLEDYSNSVSVFAPSDSGEDITRKFNEYIKSESDRNASELMDLTETLTNLKSEHDQLNSQISYLQDSVNAKTNDINTKSDKLDKYDEKNKKFRIKAGCIYLSIFNIFLAFFFLLGKSFLGYIFIIFSIIPILYVIWKVIEKKRTINEIKILKSEKKNINKQLKASQKQLESTDNDIQSIEKSIYEYQ